MLVVWRLSACRHGKVGLEDDCFIGGVNAPTCLMCGRTRGPDEMRVGSPAQTRNSGFTGSSHCGVWGWWSKRPRGRGQCRGTTTEHRSSPWAPHQPKLACNSGTRTFCSARKRCNSNGAISTFEIRVGELHATFLRNHNMRRHKGTTKCPKQETTQAQKTPTTPTAATTATSTGALHPLCGGAPDMGHCTRYVAVHPNRRGALPTDRVQCPNIQEQTRNWHTEPLTAAPLHAQLGPTGGRTGTPPTPPPAPRPTPTPPTPLHAKSPITPGVMLPNCCRTVRPGAGSMRWPVTSSPRPSRRVNALKSG